MSPWRKGVPEASPALALLCLSAFSVLFFRKCQPCFAVWRRKGSQEWPTCVSLPPEQAERDGPPHRAANASALFVHKGAHPCLTSHAVSEAWRDCLRWLRHLSAQQDLGIFVTGPQRTLLKCQSGKTLHPSEIPVTKPTERKLLLLKWQNPYVPWQRLLKCTSHFWELVLSKLLPDASTKHQWACSQDGQRTLCWSLCSEVSVPRGAPKGFVKCDSLHLEPSQAFLCPQAGQVKRNGARTKACSEAQGSNGQASKQRPLPGMIFRGVAWSSFSMATRDDREDQPR